jgi:hypothetical protein
LEEREAIGRLVNENRDMIERLMKADRPTVADITRPSIGDGLSLW